MEGLFKGLVGRTLVLFRTFTWVSLELVMVPFSIAMLGRMKYEGEEEKEMVGGLYKLGWLGMGSH